MNNIYTAENQHERPDTARGWLGGEYRILCSRANYAHTTWVNHKKNTENGSLVLPFTGGLRTGSVLLVYNLHTNKNHVWKTYIICCVINATRKLCTTLNVWLARRRGRHTLYGLMCVFLFLQEGLALGQRRLSALITICHSIHLYDAAGTTVASSCIPDTIPHKAPDKIQTKMTLFFSCACVVRFVRGKL